REVRAAIGRVIYRYDYVTRQQPLDSGAPLVDLRSPVDFVAEVAGIAESPLGEFAVFSALRRRKAGRKRISQGRVLCLVEIFGEVDRCGFVERRTGVLKIGGNVGSVVNAPTGPDHRLPVPAISQPYPRCNVSSIDSCGAMVRCCKNSGADQGPET